MKNLKSLLVSFLLIVPQLVTAEPETTQAISSTNVGILSSLLHASFIVQFVLLILILLSVFCWAIGWSKYKQFSSIKKANEDFDSLFWSTSSLDSLFTKIDEYQESPHARVFKAAYVEMKKIAESPLHNNQKNESDSLQLSGLDNIERSIRKSTDNELASMETKLNILASTGSTGPFIGLFGTVWGIMNSFHQIGLSGNASLAAVAPGISEALVATAIGLAAAIPAVIIYNNCNAVIRKEEISLNNFNSDFLNIIKRNFFKA